MLQERTCNNNSEGRIGVLEELDFHILIEKI